MITRRTILYSVAFLFIAALLVSSRRTAGPGVGKATPIRRAPPPANNYCLKGEFDDQELLLVGADALSDSNLDFLAAIVQEVHEHVRVVILTARGGDVREIREGLAARGLPAAAEVRAVPMHSIWLRDCGPFVVGNARGRRLVVKTAFGPLPEDRDGLAMLISESLQGLPILGAPVFLEGGGFLTNGRGLGITTNRTLTPNLLLHDNERQIREILRQQFGCQDLVFLEPLAGEPTGHVDMFATFPGPDTVVVGEYAPEVDPENAVILDATAARLANLPTRGRSLRVVRMPMPPNRDGVWRTYTNVVYANGVLLVPVYPGVDPTGETRALNTYRELLPDWKVVGIDARQVIQAGGALHCLCLNVPAAVSAGAGNHAASRENASLPVAAEK